MFLVIALTPCIIGARVWMELMSSRLASDFQEGLLTGSSLSISRKNNELGNLTRGELENVTRGELDF